MNLIPLGDRVLIRPDKAPEQTESGLHVVEHWKPEQTGVVVAVGTVEHPRKVEVEAIADQLHEGCNNEDCPISACVTAKLLRELVAREPLVKPGDAVIFSWSAGSEFRIGDDGERLLCLRISDVLAVIEPESVNA